MPAPNLTPWMAGAGETGGRYAFNQFAADGSHENFGINFTGIAPGYLDRSHVEWYTTDSLGVSTDPEVVDPTFWQSDTVINLVDPITGNPIATGMTISIFRNTPKDVPIPDFTDGSVINEENLDDGFRQAVYVAAEMVDRFSVSQDTSEQALAQSETALDTANAATDAAAAAVTTANAAESSAATASSDASNAVTTANAAAATANGIAGTANAAFAAASQAETDAANALGTANAIAGTANTALSNSNAAVSTANDASTAAAAATSTANGVDSKATTALTSSAAAVATANAANQKSANLSDVANVATARANLGVGRTLISTVTTTASSAVFTGLSSSYDMYEIVFHDLIGSVNGAAAILQISSDGGSTWKTGAGFSIYTQNFIGNSVSAPAAAGQSVALNSTGISVVTNLLVTGGAVAQEGTVELRRPSGTTFNKYFYYRWFGYNSSSDLVQAVGGGVANSPAAYNAVRIVASTGTLSGKFSLYGINS